MANRNSSEDIQSLDSTHQQRSSGGKPHHRASAFSIIITGIVALTMLQLGIFAQDISISRIDTAQASSDRLSTIGDGIQFEIEETTFFYTFDGDQPDLGILLLVLGRFTADENRCVHGYDFKLAISSREYEASTWWMDKFNSYAGNRDYPGWGFTGQCMNAGISEPTYLVFDVPAAGTTSILRFFEGEIALGDWVQLQPTMTPTPTATNSPTATFTSTATSTPTNTSTPTPTSTPFETVRVIAESARFRECPQTSCEIVQVLGRGEHFDVVEAVEGDAASGSTIWYRAIIDGQAAYVHSSLMASLNMATPTRKATLVRTSTPRLTVATAKPATGQTVDIVIFSSPRVWYAASNGNIRECPATTCRSLGTLVTGDTVTLDASTEGQVVNGGNSQWYRIQGSGFVYSGVVSSSRPSVQQPAQPAQPTQPGLPVIPQSTAAPPQFVCGGDFYNCGDFTGNRQALHDYWAACPGDPSRLDQGGEPGIPCENIW